MNQKGFYSVFLLVILVVLIGISFYFFKKSIKEPPPEIPFGQGLINNDLPKAARMFPSVNNKHILLAQQNGLENKCTYQLFDKWGTGLTNDMLNEFMKDINCRPTQRLEIDGLKSFSGDNLIFELKKGEITIFNIVSGETSKLAYNSGIEPEVFGFHDADPELRYAFYSQQGYPFISLVRDFDGKDVLDIMPLLQIDKYPVTGSFYDPVNKGIFYIQTLDNTYRFSYLDLDTKRLRLLKTLAINKEMSGHGCWGNYISSSQGKLMLNGDCLNLLSKDKNEKGEVVFSL